MNAYLFINICIYIYIFKQFYTYNGYNDINFISYLKDEGDVKQELARLYNYVEEDINSLKYKTIKDNGYVTPVKKWVLDAIWDSVNKNDMQS